MSGESLAKEFKEIFEPMSNMEKVKQFHKWLEDNNPNNPTKEEMLVDNLKILNSDFERLTKDMDNHQLGVMERWMEYRVQYIKNLKSINSLIKDTE